MAHSSSMGKYGILHIVNRKNNSPAYSYPVDNEETSFGRDDDCDIRLLYGWVSGLHCKLFFQNSKAFLTIYGLNGVIVDGCHIGRNPHADGESSETTIPIMNNSQIEIYRKRFVFEYPSKELRIKAMAEPASVRPRRALRLSMIQSAQVFTPSKPSADTSTPKSHRRRRSETLAEQLQSPIKPFSPARPTPLSNMGRETLTTADEEREVTLVGARGAQSVVVLEEEKDLVVVEAVGDDSDEEDLSDEEEIIKDKENENPFDVGRSPAQRTAKPIAAPGSPAPVVQRSLSTNTPGHTPSYTPKRPTLHRNAVSAPTPAPPQAPAPTPQPARTPARKARFSLHKAVLLRSAQRQLIERERLNQLQMREPTIFDDDADVEMADAEPEFADEPETDPALNDPDADEEDAVEAVVSPKRPKTERSADGSFSDESEQSMDQSVSEGDVSVESDISDTNMHSDQEDEEEPKDVPLGSRIRTSLSALGSILPNLLKSPTKQGSALSEDTEEVDIVDQRGDAAAGQAVKVEPVDDEHEELHFPSDSEDEDEMVEDEHEASNEDGVPTHEPESDPVHTGEPVDAFVHEVTVKTEDTPVQPRRLNAFMTPQVARPNFTRAPAGRKSVALGAQSGDAGDVSWLPSRVPASAQEPDSDEEESNTLEEPATEDVQAGLLNMKQLPEWDPEEKAARRQSALAVLAAGPRQLPNRRQSVAAHLVKSEPIDPNDRRMTLAGTALDAPAGTPQHASTLSKVSDYEIAIDSSDEEEAPAESAMDTLRKKIDYMRRQSMSRAARETPIGPLFGDVASNDVKLEDSEEIVKAEEVEAVKQELEEAEKELEELEDEAETETELSVDDSVDGSEDEDEASEQDISESERADAQEQSDVESPEQQGADSDHDAVHEEDEPIQEDAKAVIPLLTGPSTPALKGIRALFRADEVKGLGTQTPAGLDGMLHLFGPEVEDEAEPTIETETKPSRLRTKSADPARSRIATAASMTRAKSSQTALEAKSSEVVRTRSTDTRVKAEPAAVKAAPVASRIATRTLREPSKLPSRVQTPTEEPESSATKTTTRKASGTTTVSVVLPRRTKSAKAEPEVKEEPAPIASKLKAPTKRVTRTASAMSNTTEESKPVTRTASSTRSRATGATTPVLPEEPKATARSTRTKAAATTAAARRKETTSTARPVTPVSENVDDHDPMDVIPLPESPTKRSTRAKASAVKSEPEDEDSVPTTRSRTRAGDSDTVKGKRTTTKRVVSKDPDENKENTAVDVPEPETDTKVKPSALPTRTTRKTAPTASKLPAPTKTASKTEPATTTSTRALRTRATRK